MKRESGFSILEVVIVAGILGVVMMFVTTTMVHIQKTQKTVGQKFEAAELTNYLQRIVKTSALCDWQVTPLTVDSTQVSLTSVPSAYEVNVGTLYNGKDNTTGILAAANAPVPGTQTGLVVSAVKLKNFLRTSSAPIPPEVTADFDIVFTQASMPMAISSVRATAVLTLNTADPPNAMRVTSCDAPAGSVPGTAQFLVVTYQVPSDQEGGAFGAANVWVRRPLNTVRVPNGIAGSSMAANQITLPAGTYRIFASGHADSVDDNAIRWQNVTTGTTVIMGTMAFAADDAGVGSDSMVVGVFTINATQTFELQHIFGPLIPSRAAALAAYGYGMGGAGCLGDPPCNGSGAPNVFTLIEIQKLN